MPTSWLRGSRRRSVRCDGAHEDALPGRALVAVGLLLRDRQRAEVARAHARPERHVRALVERPDRYQHAGVVLQPGLVEAPAVEARQTGRIQLDAPARGRLGQVGWPRAPGTSSVGASARLKCSPVGPPDLTAIRAPTMIATAAAAAMPPHRIVLGRRR